MRCRTARRRLTVLTVLAVAGTIVLAGCAGAPEPEAAAADPDDDHFPVTISACGHETTLAAAPERAVTLNQGATEVALALGVEDQLAGTAYLDDAVPEKWAGAYESVEVLSDSYPTREQLLAVEPDFVYASYGSAFEKKAVGTQTELAGTGAASYLSPFGCAEEDRRPEPSYEAVWQEVDAVADAFGVPERAERIREEQQAQLDELAASAPGAGVDVFWYDSGDKEAYAGAGEGGPQLVLDAIGATNIFAGVDGGWATVSWEQVVDADPDVIVLADAAWSTAEEKIDQLEQDPALRELRAVRQRAYVVVPFSASTPGVRLVDGAVSVGDQIADLDLAE
jgi:iron complex transport system substrate-binding protein